MLEHFSTQWKRISVGKCSFLQLCAQTSASWRHWLNQAQHLCRRHCAGQERAEPPADRVQACAGPGGRRGQGAAEHAAGARPHSQGMPDADPSCLHTLMLLMLLLPLPTLLLPPLIWHAYHLYTHAATGAARACLAAGRQRSEFDRLPPLWAGALRPHQGPSLPQGGAFTACMQSRISTPARVHEYLCPILRCGHPTRPASSAAMCQIRSTTASLEHTDEGCERMQEFRTLLLNGCLTRG